MRPTLRRRAGPRHRNALGCACLQHLDRHTLERLDWGRALAAHMPGFTCRLAEAGETPTIDLHSATDRPPLAVHRLAADIGWNARFGCADSASHLAHWARTLQNEAIA